MLPYYLFPGLGLNSFLILDHKDRTEFKIHWICLGVEDTQLKLLKMLKTFNWVIPFHRDLIFHNSHAFSKSYYICLYINPVLLIYQGSKVYLVHALQYM